MADKWAPIIDTDRCTGCGRCMEACGPKSLALLDGIAVLARPETCGSEEHCIAPCEEEAIRMAWVPVVGDPAVGRWRESA